MTKKRTKIHEILKHKPQRKEQNHLHDVSYFFSTQNASFKMEVCTYHVFIVILLTRGGGCGGGCLRTRMRSRSTIQQHLLQRSTTTGLRILAYLILAPSPSETHCLVKPLQTLHCCSGTATAAAPPTPTSDTGSPIWHPPS